MRDIIKHVSSRRVPGHRQGRHLAKSVRVHPKLIAAYPLELGVVLVTNIEKDCARYPGIVTENSLKPAVGGLKPANPH